MPTLDLAVLILAIGDVLMNGPLAQQLAAAEPEPKNVISCGCAMIATMILMMTSGFVVLFITALIGGLNLRIATLRPVPLPVLPIVEIGERAPNPAAEVLNPNLAPGPIVQHIPIPKPATRKPVLPPVLPVVALGERAPNPVAEAPNPNLAPELIVQHIPIPNPAIHRLV